MSDNSSYPNSIDSFSEPYGDTSLNSTSAPHADLHRKVNNAIEAIQTTLGINPANYDPATPVNSLTVAGRLSDIEDRVEEIAQSSFGRLPNDSVTTAKIVDGAVTEVKIVDGAITTAKLASGAVTNTKIAGNTISGDKLASQTVTYSQLKPFTKIHISRPHSTPQRLGVTELSTVTWLDELVPDPDNLVPATPPPNATPSTRYNAPQSTIVIPADSSYDGVYMISTHIKGFRSNLYDSVKAVIKDANGAVINTFYANSGGTGSGSTPLSYSLNHILDLKQSYTIDVSAYNSDAASPIYISGDLYLIKLSN